MRKLLIGLTAVASLAIASPAIAAGGTGGGATIHNAATLTWGDGQGQITDWVNVSVRTIGTAPNFEADIVQANPQEEATVVYTVTSLSNGYDVYSLDFSTVANDVTEATNYDFSPQITLAASIISRAPIGNAILIPAGSETGFAAGQTVHMEWGNGNYYYTVDEVYVGTPAFTQGNTTTPEDPSRLTLTPQGSAPAINNTNALPGVQVGQVAEYIFKLTTGTPTEPGKPGKYNVTVEATPSQPDENGATITTPKELEGLVEVLSGEATLLKEVRNVTQNGDFTAHGASSTVQAMSDDELEYRLTVKAAVAGGTITGAILFDSLPEHTTYVLDSTTLNGGSIADVNGLSPLFSTNGLGVHSENGDKTTNQVLEDEAAVVTFKVTVK